MAVSNGQRTLPAVVRIPAADANRIPSPGTQRLLRAQTGRDFQDFMAVDGDSPDRFQTLIWIHLRRDIPDLTWQECADVDVIIDNETSRPDPTSPPVSTTSPSSADSGG